MTEKEAQQLVKQARQGQTVPPAPKSGTKPDGVTSDGEEAFIGLYRLLNPTFPMPERQYQLRVWTIDFAFPDHKILIEIEGVSHRLPPRYYNDIWKYNTLSLEGWTLLRITGKMLSDDPARFFAMIDQAYFQAEEARLAKVGKAAVARLREEYGMIQHPDLEKDGD